MENVKSELYHWTFDHFKKEPLTNIPIVIMQSYSTIKGDLKKRVLENNDMSNRFIAENNLSCMNMNIVDIIVMILLT